MRLLAAGLLLLAGSWGGWLAAEPRFALPETWIPGNLHEVYGWEAGSAGFRVDLERPSGKLLARAKAFVLSGEALSAALLPLEVTTAPGPVVVKLFDAKGVLLETRAASLEPRLLATEVLKLDKAMTTLRAVPDPQKDREAEQIWAIYLKRRPTVLGTGPVKLPVEGFTTTSSFGDSRRYEYSDGSSASDYHRGTDFATPVGTAVNAPLTGVVVLSANRKLTGQTLVIEHAPTVYSVYFHLKTRAVAEGAQVVAGQRLATSGASGLVTGPHLHWEFRCQGIPIDPLSLVRGGLLDKDKRNALISSIEQKRG